MGYMAMAISGLWVFMAYEQFMNYEPTTRRPCPRPPHATRRTCQPALLLLLLLLPLLLLLLAAAEWGMLAVGCLGCPVADLSCVHL
jgi:hypothetical protein